MTRTILKPSLAKKVDDRFLSVTEVADYLGCDRITVRNMLKDGRLKAYTLGPRMLRIRLSDIESALQPYGGGDHATG
jgi:excisionase family DNA binding protein